MCKLHIIFQIYLERLIREDRDKQIEKLSHSSECESVKEISKVEVNAVSSIRYIFT